MKKTKIRIQDLIPNNPESSKIILAAPPLTAKNTLNLQFSSKLLNLGKMPTALDLSSLPSRRSIINDLIGARAINREQKDYIEIHPDLNPSRFRSALSVFLTGCLLLLAINGINSWYRGIDLKNYFLNKISASKNQINEISRAFKDDNFLKINNALGTLLSDLDSAKKKLPAGGNNNILGQNAENILQSGKLLLEAGITVTKSVENLKNIFLFSADSFFNQKNDSLKKTSLTDELEKEFNQLSAAFEKIETARTALQNINPAILPVDYQQKIFQAKNILQTAQPKLNNIRNFFPAILEMMGSRHPQTYLILFANNNEQRPIMGFLGSGMILELNDGWVTKNEVFDIYEIDGLIVEHIPLPKVFETITGNLGVRDSNYSPDGAVSGELAAHLFQKAGRPSVDGVFFIDLEVLKSMLAITGPLKLGGLNIPLYTNNFDQVLSLIVESKVEGQNDPKKIIKRLIPTIFQKIAAEKKWPEIATQFPKLITEKHLIAYSRNPQIQEFFRYLDLDGEIRMPEQNQDYLSVINTSIGGNKSDYYIDENISLKNRVLESGQIINEVNIKRNHRFNQAARDFLITLALSLNLPSPDDQLMKILGAGKNIVSTRIYVPKGSRLKKVSGIDPKAVEVKYDQEVDLSYFQSLLETAAGSSTEITLSYELPFRLNFRDKPHMADYSILIEKQAGGRNTFFHQEIQIPPTLHIIKALPQAVKSKDTIATFENFLNTDQNLALLLGK